MNRNLKFNLEVETNALLCANPEEFYSKAYLQSEDIASNFRSLPGIKSKTGEIHLEMRDFGKCPNDAYKVNINDL